NMITRLALFAALAICWPAPAANVIINEVMYHPPNDGDDLQYVELLNSGEMEADISGWQIAGGVRFTIPPARLPAGGFLVVARNTNAFRDAYNSTSRVVGNFSGKLSHKGEKLQLLDGAGALVETVEYKDKAPWPVGADGFGS